MRSSCFEWDREALMRMYLQFLRWVVSLELCTPRIAPGRSEITGISNFYKDRV